jgi:hypothetical protein
MSKTGLLELLLGWDVGAGGVSNVCSSRPFLSHALFSGYLPWWACVWH